MVTIFCTNPAVEEKALFLSTSIAAVMSAANQQLPEMTMVLIVRHEQTLAGHCVHSPECFKKFQKIPETI